MNKERKEELESMGWKVGSDEGFLELCQNYKFLNAMEKLIDVVETTDFDFEKVKQVSSMYPLGEICQK